MGKARFIRNRGKLRKENSVIEMDITSLLDILVILLVFLLKSYNANVMLNVPSGIILPTSESKKINTAGVMVQVSPTTIWVDDKVVLASEDLISQKSELSYDMGGRRIIPLYNELTKKIEKIKQIQKSAPDAPKFSGIVNLIVDKSFGYNYLKKLMFTCAEAGFRKYKFVVLSSEQY